MTEYCDECGEELPDSWELDLCSDCMNDFAASVIHTDDMFPDLEDFE